MLYVCSLAELEAHVAALRPGYVVSVIGTAEQPATPAGLGPERHHRMSIDDITLPVDGGALAQEAHVAALIDFLDTRDRHEAVLFHCMAGVSRSTAAALVALALDAEGREDEAAERLYAAAPHAHPNRRIVALADRLLQRDGRLIAAREAMGPLRPGLATPLIRIEPLPAAPAMRAPASR